MLVPDINQWRFPKQIALFHSPPGFVLKDHLEQQLTGCKKKVWPPGPPELSVAKKGLTSTITNGHLLLSSPRVWSSCNLQLISRTNCHRLGIPRRHRPFNPQWRPNNFNWFLFLLITLFFDSSLCFEWILLTWCGQFCGGLKPDKDSRIHLERGDTCSQLEKSNCCYGFLIFNLLAFLTLVGDRGNRT